MVYVIIQFSCIALLLFSTNFGQLNLSGWFLGFTAATIGLWAIQAMKWPHVSIMPDPKKATHVVTRGPYRWIRHPMYTAVLLLCAGLLLTNLSIFRVLVFTVLAVDLYLKMRYEEKKLSAKFTDYSAYKTKTWALIPFIF